MPITQTIDHARRRTTTTVTGPVHLTDIEEHWRVDLAEHGEGYPKLVDARHATIAFNTAEVRRMVHLIRTTHRGRSIGPTAVVVRTEVGYGMVRMFGLMLEPECEVVPFRELAAAEEWLDAFDGRGDGRAAGSTVGTA